MIKVAIVDDNEFITGGLKIILEADPQIEVVGVEKDGVAGVSFVQNNDVDVVLMDVRMPNLNGVDATKEIVKKTHTKVIILTTFDEDEYIDDAIINGAAGYLLKNNEPNHIIDAIKMVNSGQSIIQSDVWNHVRQKLQEDGSVSRADLSELTKREVEIVEQVGQGLSNKEIAKKLFISEGTVNNNLSVILHKLELEHRTQLAIYYLTGKIGE